MSKYTTEVRYICENYASLNESKGYNDIETILDGSWNKVFDFPFPIFNEEYREDLCKKILRHYYTREICEETVGLWKLRLNSRMNEIMPYYNKLYNSELISIEPLINTRLSGTKQNKKSGTDTINTSGNTQEASTLGGTTVRTGGYTDTNTGTDTLAKTGTIGKSGSKTGTEELAKIGTIGKSGSKTGTEALAKTGTIGKSGSKTGTEALAKVGTEDETKTGKITKTKEGEISDTRTGQGVTTERYEGKGGKITDENIDLFSDTPHGNIANMGNEYGTQQNPSNVPIVGDDTSYLTTAEKTTNSREDRSKWEKENGFGEDSDGNPYKETNTRFYGHDDGEGNITPYKEEEDYNQDGVKVEKSFTDRTDTTTYNVSTSETQTNNTTDTTTFNIATGETQTNNTTDTTTFNIANTETQTNNTTDTTTKNLTDQRVYNSLTDTKNDSGTKSTNNSGLKSILYGAIDDGTEAILGSKGISDSKLLQEFRETFLNIDEMVIGKLKDLFILLW